MRSWNDGSSRWVQLKDMQATTVGQNLPPTIAFTITQEDQMLFMRQLTTCIATQSKHHHTPAPKGSLGSGVPVSITPPGGPNPLNTLTTVTVPPRVVPPPPPAPTPTHGSGTYLTS